MPVAGGAPTWLGRLYVGEPPSGGVGIDLGTTNPLLAVAGRLESGRNLLAGDGSESSFDHHIPVELLPLPQRNLDGTEVESILFPSVVFQMEAGAPRFVGGGAREARSRSSADAGCSTPSGRRWAKVFHLEAFLPDHPEIRVA